MSSGSSARKKYSAASIVTESIVNQRNAASSATSSSPSPSPLIPLRLIVAVSIVLIGIALAAYIAQLAQENSNGTSGADGLAQANLRVPRLPAFTYSNNNDDDDDAARTTSTTPTNSPHFGTYRSNVYLGIRGLFPTSPLFGWAWSCAGTSVACSQEQQINGLRHDAEERDGVERYGWVEHNGEDYGKHECYDRKMGVNLTAQVLMVREGASKEGEKFVVRMTAEPISGAGIDAISLYSYISLTTGEHSMRLLDGEEDEKRVAIDMGDKLGEYVLRSGVAASSSSSSKATPEGVYYYGINLPPPGSQVQRQNQQNQQQYETWQAKQLIQQALTDQYRSKWQQHSSSPAVQNAARTHEKRYQGQPSHTVPQFQPPPPPPFVSTLPNTVAKNANFLVVQRVCRLPCTVDYVVQTEKEDATVTTAQGKEIGGTETWFSPSASLESTFFSHSHLFRRLFDHTFPIRDITSADTRAFSSYLLSNMLGGIGYFYGPQLIEVEAAVPATKGKQGKQAKIVETSPSALLTAVPSRSFFPRGFMWDEGFHHLLISRWNLDLSLSILSHWFSQVRMDSFSKPIGGWLPREQILGSEARARVPKEFQAQKPWVANPPTMMVTLRMVLERLVRKEEEERKNSGEVSKQTRSEIKLFNQFLHTWLPVIHQHVQWFFVTQASVSKEFGEVKTMVSGQSSSAASQTDALSSLPSSFRWQGRTLDHCLASGLDDYPRASWLPTEKDRNVKQVAQEEKDRAAGLLDLVKSIGSEGHVDLHAWMIVLAKTMSGLMKYAVKHGDESSSSFSSSLDYTSLSSTYSLYVSTLTSSLHSLHYDPLSQIYSDYAYKNGTRRFIKHIGYVSLLPLFLNVIDPTSPNLLPLLQQIRSQSWSIWTPAGIRSLSSTDKLFGEKEDYWKGHIWINMQVLGVQGLEWYAANENASQEVRHLAKEIATELKHNIVTNVGSEFKRTGFVYEQYHAMTGAGRKSHPFTGWTALTLLLMTEDAA